jgi:hypothetical protein
MKVNDGSDYRVNLELLANLTKESAISDDLNDCGLCSLNQIIGEKKWLYDPKLLERAQHI